MLSGDHWQSLRPLMDRHLGADDLEEICLVLHIDSSHLAGVSKSARLISLLDLLNRRKKIPDLVIFLRKNHSHIPWPDFTNTSPTIPPTIQDSSKPWQTFRQLMDQYLSVGDLEAIIFDLGVDSAHLSGPTKPDRIISLLKLMIKKEKIADLLLILQKRHAHVRWPEESTLATEMLEDPAPTAIQQASNRIKNHDFDMAISVLKQALDDNPHHPGCNLLIAVASFRGNGANKMTDESIRGVETYLKFAAAGEQTKKLSLFALGIIKYDYYYSNSLPVGEPQLHEIREQYSRQTTVSDYDWCEAFIKASPQAVAYLKNRGA